MAQILVIDDSPTVVHAVRRALAQDGHKVDSLDLFVGLLGRIHDQPPDLIILDLDMPGLSGLKLGKVLRGSTTRAIPVCLYSSQPLAELQAAAKEIGAVAVLEKQRSIEELRRMVADVLHPRSMKAAR